MKQVLFRSRLSPFAARDTPAMPGSTPRPSHPGPALPPAAAAGEALMARLKAARMRHSACGVSCLLVRQAETILGTLEGAQPYVDRMQLALSTESLLEDLDVLSDHTIHDREFSQVALSLVEVNTLVPPPAWAQRCLRELDLRAVRRLLKSQRAFHGLHAQPIRASHLHNLG